LFFTNRKLYAMKKSKPLKILSSILQAIGLSATCVLANYAWAVNPYIDGPSYLLPYAGELDNSWISSLGLPNQNPIAASPADIPTTVMVDGQRKIDLTTEGAAFAEIANQPLIEIAIPGHNTRYVFTSMQNFVDFSMTAQLPLIQQMTEHAKYLESVGKDPFADLSWVTQINQGKPKTESAKMLLQEQATLNSQFEVLSDTTTQISNIDLPTQSSAKLLMPGGWDTDESVWVMNYPYVSCTYGSHGGSIVRPRCGHSSASVGILTYTSGVVTGTKWFWGEPGSSNDDSAVITARGNPTDFHVRVSGRQQVDIAGICEIESFFGGCYEYWTRRDEIVSDSNWYGGDDVGEGLRAVVMGKYADLLIARAAGTMQGRTVTRDLETLSFPTIRVLVKSPIFWSFCSLVPGCRNSFTLLGGGSANVHPFIPWQNFILIPNARDNYFNTTFNLPGRQGTPEPGFLQVYTYRERVDPPGAVGFSSAEGLSSFFFSSYPDMAAAVEASTGCDAVILPPRYRDHVRNMMIDRGRSCVVPRMNDGSPMLQVFDRNAMPAPRYVSPFFYDNACFEQADPATCIRNSPDPCRMIYLDVYRYDLRAAIGGPWTEATFATCSAHYRRPLL
jgi:hypothetical protein